MPVFAVSWILTWFSHSFKKIQVIQRIFDFLISSPPSSILYMCAALILISKEKLLESAGDDDLDVKTIFPSPKKFLISVASFLSSNHISKD